MAQASWCKLAELLLQGAVLDRHSACCAGGTLDACGACGGSARAVDVQNVCCSSGELDGDGYCCQSGLVDECGVCDGQSTACALSAVLDVQVSVTAACTAMCMPLCVMCFVKYLDMTSQSSTTA